MSILTDKQLDDMAAWHATDYEGDPQVIHLINEVRELRKLLAAINNAIAAAQEISKGAAS